IQNRSCGSLTTIANFWAIGGAAGSVMANTTPACPPIDRYVGPSDRNVPGDDAWADWSTPSTTDLRYALSSRTVVSRSVSRMRFVVKPSWSGPWRIAANVTSLYGTFSWRLQSEGIGTRNPRWFSWVRSGMAGIAWTVRSCPAVEDTPNTFV